MTHPKPRTHVTVPSTHGRHRLRGREWPRPPRRDPHTRLIAQLLERAGPDASVIATSSRPWASATFLGTRHVILLKLGGADHALRADHLAETLPDAEFTIAGHIVADLCLDERLVRATQSPDPTDTPMASPTETVLRLSVLTIEEW